MNDGRPWIVVGNPENRRIAFLQQALASRGLPPAKVISYRDLLRGHCSVDQVPQGAIVRVESPGENFAVEKLLLAAGEHEAMQENSPTISAQQLESLSDDPGRILFPRQWYLGYVRTLLDLRDQLPEDVFFTSQIADIARMFNKRECHAECQQAGIAVPRTLTPPNCLDELIVRMREAGLERVFVKLDHGSSASGVVAIYHRQGSLEAITSCELVRSEGEIRLYNSLKIRRYTSVDDIGALIDSLAAQRVHVEQWLPKASAEGRVCDLRIVVIAGEPQHMVVRTSRTPLTNLHLGNRRGNLGDFLARIPQPQLIELNALCRHVAHVFPNTIQMGLDVLLTPGFRQAYLLEVNAFGDLLPGVLYGVKNSYEAQVDAVVSAPVGGAGAMPRRNQ